MQILLLGTGAAEGIPAFYSNSRVSEYARLHGGRDVRTRSGAIIDGSLKIDLPPDTLTQMTREGLNPRDWSALLFTHGDDDHFAASEIQYCLHPFSEMEYLDFTIYGNDRVSEGIELRYPDWPMEVVQTRSFEAFTHADFTITPIEANHNGKEDCQNHIIERGGKRLLYATDTGVWTEKTWAFLEGVSLGLLVIECTQGFVESDFEGHLSLSSCVKVVNRLRMLGILRSNSKVVTTHHSHSGDATHSELKDALKPHDIDVGYDGLSIEI